MLSNSSVRVSVVRAAARYGVTVALLSLAAATTAHAQIYTWRDASGNLVLSNRPQNSTAPVRAYAVPKAENVRATRAVAGARSRLYDDLLVEHARKNDVRIDLVRAVVQVESAYNPQARSPKGAMGLMQLMPATAQEFAVSDPYDPADNVRAGVAYLRQLLDRYQNDEQLALAAYNAGPGAVDKHGQTVPPYRETRNYVAQINQIAKRPIELRDRHIYKVVDVVDGRSVTRYTDKKPASGVYDVVVSR
jgi:soluble lytic murein transglycosylase-like protein